MKHDPCFRDSITLFNRCADGSWLATVIRRVALIGKDDAKNGRGGSVYFSTRYIETQGRTLVSPEAFDEPDSADEDVFTLRAGRDYLCCGEHPEYALSLASHDCCRVIGKIERISVMGGTVYTVTF